MNAGNVMRIFLPIGALVFLALVVNLNPSTTRADEGTIRLYSVEEQGYVIRDRVVRTEAEWKKVLTPEQFAILRDKGTERPFTGKYLDNHEAGIYRCAACGTDLFLSETKYNSRTGWPSYWAPVAEENVVTADDYSLFGIRRNEILCGRCGSHLGHVFNDGPPPTGLRYCVNSASLVFVPFRKSG